MIRKIPAFSFPLLFFAAGQAAPAQFTSAEISRRPFWEEFLKTAEIVRAEEVGEGVTKPLAVYLKQGETEQKCCWKNPRGLKFGFLEGWQYEIAAYELDKLIGLNMIPPTIEREYRGKHGALSLWAESQYSLLKMQELGIGAPAEARAHVDDMKYLARAWDCLIANEDRTQQNVLYTADWRMIIFDHSRAFRSSREFTERLMFGKNGLKMTAAGEPLLFRRLPRWFVEKVKALDFQAIKEAVGPYLTDKEIEAILKRKALLLAEVEELVKQVGEEKVLY